MTHPIYPCLWFNNQAREAAQYYCGIFKDAKILDENDIVSLIQLNGTKFMLLNGGPAFNFTEASSYVVSCDTQEEIDHYWNSLTADGGKESMCGWLKDKYGVSWQIVPARWQQIMSHPEKGQRSMQAMMKMKKLVIAELENPE
jgi:Uncharacterized protein conserved in bacteria